MKEFFVGADGKLSSTRLMAYQLVTAGCLIAIAIVALDRVNLDTIGLVTSLVGSGLAGKKWIPTFKGVASPTPQQEVNSGH